MHLGFKCLVNYNLFSMIMYENFIVLISCGRYLDAEYTTVYSNVFLNHCCLVVKPVLSLTKQTRAKTNPITNAPNT